MNEVYDEWWAQGCPRNESGDPVLLPDSCDCCPFQYDDDCKCRWEHCPMTRGRKNEGSL